MSDFLFVLCRNIFFTHIGYFSEYKINYVFLTHYWLYIFSSIISIVYFDTLLAIEDKIDTRYLINKGFL